jgi:intracellular sulfur oxidation DsrE/DsrF family protein
MIPRIRFLFVLVIVCQLSFISSAFAALSGPDKGEMKNVVFHVKTQTNKKSTLEALKMALNNIGYQIEKKFDGKGQFNLFVVVHGDNLNWFQKNKIDAELEFMVQWFLRKGVDLRVCNPCLEELNLSLVNLVEGFKPDMN